MPVEALRVGNERRARTVSGVEAVWQLANMSAKRLGGYASCLKHNLKVL